MTRVPYATRENMDAAGQAIWDDIETSRGGVARNYAALLNNPQASAAMIGLGTYARYNTPMDPRIKALAVLTAARAGLRSRRIPRLSGGRRHPVHLRTLRHRKHAR